MTPQETDPDLPVSVQEATAEAWVGSGPAAGLWALTVAVPATLHQATTDPHLLWRLLDTHGQVWVSLSWRHCSFLPGPGAHKVLFVYAKSLFPQSCVSSGGSMVG